MGRCLGGMLLLLLTAVAGKRILAGIAEGYRKDWKYVEKFAFAKTTADNPGLIQIRAWTFMPDQKLLIYHGDAWFDAYGASSYPCSSRAGLASRNQSVPKGRFYGEAGAVVREQVVQDKPAYWFLAIARCRDWLTQSYDSCTGSPSVLGLDTPNGVFMYYELTMLNPGGYWTEHFSADEHGLLQMHLVFMAAYLVTTAAVASFVVKRVSSARGQGEPIAQCALLISGIFFGQHVLMGLQMHHYAQYGRGYEWAVHVADAAGYLAEVLLTMLLLVLGKGWMISRTTLKRRTKLLQGAFTFAIAALYATVFIIDIFERDPAATYHKFETGTARALGLCRFLLLGYFYWCVRRSYDQEQRGTVQLFYARLGVVGSGWLLTLPLCTAIAAELHAWDRLRVMSGMTFTANFVATVALAMLSYPQDIAPVYLASETALATQRTDATTHRRRPLGSGTSIAPEEDTHAPQESAAHRAAPSAPSAGVRTGAAVSAAKEDSSDDADTSGPAVTQGQAVGSTEAEGVGDTQEAPPNRPSRARIQAPAAW